MIYIFNVLGLAMAAAGAVIAILVAKFTPEDIHGCAALALGISWIILDVGYRFRQGKRRIFHHEHGGQLFFLPMWVWGCLSIYWSVGMLRTSIQLRHEDHIYREHVIRPHPLKK